MPAICLIRVNRERMSPMKVKRLSALLLTLLLALSCAAPALAAPGDIRPDGTPDDSEYMLTQFEITVPELPSTDNTVADVLGTTSATAVLSSVTYNNGRTGLVFRSNESMLHIMDPAAGKTLADSDSFVAGKNYNFTFFTYLPEELDIDNDLIHEDSYGNTLLDLPVYINGVLSEKITIIYHPDTDGQIAVNARYTVPAASAPAPTEKFMDTFDVLGLKLPEAGMTVRESLAKVSVKDMTLYSAHWRTGDAEYRELSPTEKFEAGKQYALVVSVENDGITYNSDADGNAVMKALLDGKTAKDAHVIGGEKKHSLPTFNWRYDVPGTPEPVEETALKEIHISGLVLPYKDLPVSDSYANVKVYYDTPGNTKKVTRVLWEEVTDDGHLIKLSDTDRFEGDKRYHLTLGMEYKGEPLSMNLDAGAARGWIAANVYVNDEKVYTGSGKEEADLTLLEDLCFTNYYTAYIPKTYDLSNDYYTDVSDDAWYADYVSTATQLGLINGMTPDTFEPNGKLTLAQAVKLAACMYQKYADGEITLANGTPWYKTYADYARDHGIINRDSSEEGISYDDVMKEPNREITRQEYAWIFARAIPISALMPVNDIPDGSIPDVSDADGTWGRSIYTLYRAGIVNGNDKKGTFSPNREIKRCEVAAIVVRMMDRTARVGAPAELDR